MDCSPHERIAELEDDRDALGDELHNTLRELVKVKEDNAALLVSLEFMQSDRDAWQAAHNELTKQLEESK